MKLPADKTLVSITDTSEDKRVLNLISSHNFASRVQLILPSSSTSAYHSHTPVKYTVRCSLAKFVTGVFINSWVKKNTCIVLSRGKIDHEDVISICNGTLTISMTKSMYERAGLQGQKSKFHRDRRIVTFDMRQVGFTKGKSGYDRLLWSLENTPLGIVREFTFVLGQGVNMNDDIEKWFEDSKLEKFEVSPMLSENEVEVPSLVVPDEYQDEWADCTYEWLGLVSLQSPAVSRNKIDEHLCKYQVLDSTGFSKVKVITWSGMISNEFTQRLWASLAESNTWFALSVHGIEDTPVAWKNNEHTYLTTGESLYSVLHVTEPTVRRILFKHLAARDLE